MLVTLLVIEMRGQRFSLSHPFNMTNAKPLTEAANSVAYLKRLLTPTLSPVNHNIMNKSLRKPKVLLNTNGHDD